MRVLLGLDAGEAFLAGIDTVGTIAVAVGGSGFFGLGTHVD